MSASASSPEPAVVPRYIRFVQEMPMTVTGKVQKFMMRQQMIDELQLQESKTA
ncbi:MAG: hypothetical protein AB1666_09075 [Pseudomonadota bacterium]|uniref:AMP-binding enzyme C-terminal domain-containing protein n=1 Tax=Caldimonas aquatica TaxID=376175 RepID=A0ABY6MX06_9BURK|nr:hypothetical protein [Schlegelella aquatica]UZD56542.1 hypothetical protein OMP39_12485 [Schlegelella aquatica]